jgi:outer membrane protein W
MKKLFIALSFSFATFYSSNDANAQAMSQGDFSVDVYYGFGSLSKAFVQEMAKPDGQFRSLGALGARFEFMASDKVGIGLEGNYLNHNATWRNENYSYEYNVRRIRVFPRINYHFGNSDSFDAYVGVGAGYRYIVRSYSTNDPNYDPDDTEGILPVAMRLAIGARYFFTDNIGLHMEFGMGGGNIVHYGLSFKL